MTGTPGVSFTFGLEVNVPVQVGAADCGGAAEPAPRRGARCRRGDSGRAGAIATAATTHCGCFADARAAHIARPGAHVSNFTV